ncbi:MAG: hypothetical protein MI747_16415 [Desulfobacterales bacterium]|nr:hypothetical protein [Desulfobacterales bacterium]
MDAIGPWAGIFGDAYGLYSPGNGNQDPDAFTPMPQVYGDDAFNPPVVFGSHKTALLYLLRMNTVHTILHFSIIALDHHTPQKGGGTCGRELSP